MKVDFEKKQAVVTIEQFALDDAKLIEALKKEGFGASVRREQSGSAADEESSGPPKPGLPADGVKPADADNTPTASGSFGKHVTVSAHLDRDALQPGDSFRIAVVIDISDGWHIYGNPLGPGIGKPTVVSAAPAEGFFFQPARYAPAHKAKQDYGESGSTWVWEQTGRVVHYLTGRIDNNAEPAEAKLELTVSAQVCNPRSCLPGSVTVPLSVRIALKDSPTQETNARLFSGFEKAKPASEDGGK